MNEATRRAIQRIDRTFYRERATDFAEKRTRPWPGWQRVVAEVERRVPTGHSPLRVLDLGCGHGRFATFLGSRWNGPFDYVGVDSSAALLELASARETPIPEAGERAYIEAELLDGEDWEGIDRRSPEAGFDLIGLFGLLHHVPGSENRRRLLERCVERLAPGGLVAVSFWQFGDEARFRRRFVAWSALAETAPLETADLEPGDHLLRWGPASELTPEAPIRYCHHATPLEADDLVATVGLLPVDVYRADGRSQATNYYVLAERSVPDRGTS